MKMETLQELYLEQLKDIYDAENQLMKALPKMAKEATNEELKAAFEQHLEQTEEQISRLDRIFEELGEKAKGHKCKAMAGLVEEGKELMEEDADEDVMDAGLICAAQKIEHYEIATYGCLRTYAEMLGFDEQADLLQETPTKATTLSLHTPSGDPRRSSTQKSPRSARRPASTKAPTSSSKTTPPEHRRSIDTSQMPETSRSIPSSAAIPPPPIFPAPRRPH